MKTKSSDPVYGIGIDTGGTYTDAVLEATHRKIADAIVAYAFSKQTGKSIKAFSTDDQGVLLFSCNFKLDVPIVNPIVAASTALAYAFEWRIVLLRMGIGYILAVFIGILMGRLFAGSMAVKDNDAVQEKGASSWGCHHHTHGEGCFETTQTFPVLVKQAGNTTACGCGNSHSTWVDWIDKSGAAFTHAMDDFLAVGHYLVIGAFIAALAQTYIDRSIFLSLASAPVVSVMLMMALAILLNLCSEADAFIAASFQGLMPISAQMAFLLTGPMFDLKLLLMYQSVFKRRAIVVLASLILATVLVIAVGLEMINGVLQ
jgi:uncharacterized membrane protein YraQ (UPF0718 family)